MTCRRRTSTTKTTPCHSRRRRWKRRREKAHPNPTTLAPLRRLKSKKSSSSRKRNPPRPRTWSSMGSNFASSGPSKAHPPTSPARGPLSWLPFYPLPRLPPLAIPQRRVLLANRPPPAARRPKAGATGRVARLRIPRYSSLKYSAHFQLSSTSSTAVNRNSAQVPAIRSQRIVFPSEEKRRGVDLQSGENALASPSRPFSGSESASRSGSDEVGTGSQVSSIRTSSRSVSSKDVRALTKLKQ